MRSSGSKGVFDLIAAGNNEVLLLQMKRTKRKPGPSAYAADIQQMQECIRKLELPTFVKAQLWVWWDFHGWQKIDVA